MKRGHIAILGQFTPDELAEAQSKGKSAEALQRESFLKLRDICCRFNQIELLARLAMVAIVEQSDFGSPKFDPKLFPYELEILQAVALSTDFKPDWNQRTIAKAIHDAILLVRENSTAFKEKSFLNLSGDSKQDKVAALLDRIRVTTQTVRGARHAFQTRAYLGDLAAALDGRFQEQLGFTASDIITLFENTGSEIGNKLTQLRARSRRWMSANDPQACLAHFLADNPESLLHPLVAEVSSGSIDISRMKGTLFAIFEESLANAFMIGPSELPPTRGKHTLWKALDLISHEFGDIDSKVIDHLHLSNPVLAKPLVLDTTGNRYLFCTQTTFSNLVEILDVFAASKPKLIQAIEAFKASWLEAKTCALLTAAFPSGAAYAAARWKDLDGKNGETDCVLSIDKTVGLFEAKSGKITAPAKRGAPERLKRQIDELLVGPSRQSARFEKLLRSSPGAVNLATKTGKVTLDASELREVFRINVLFDTIGPLSTSTRRLVEAGFIDKAEPMAPCMSVFELETILDLLPDQISKLHYLRRRCELERDALIEADEMDLIALYLESSFSIGDVAFKKEGISVYGWSDRVAKLYDHEGRRAKTSVKLKRTPMWDRLLKSIEQNAPVGWTRFGFRLCETRYADQWTIQKIKSRIMKKAHKVKFGQAVQTGVYSPEDNSLMPIALCVGNRVSEFGVFSHSETAARAVMETASMNEALVLYWDCAEADLPYKFIGTFKRFRENAL